MSKINITVQLTNNDNIVKFVTKSFITQSKSYEFNNIDDAKKIGIIKRQVLKVTALRPVVFALRK